MTPKQRVLAALRREPTDRVAIFMWFHPETARMLGRLLEIPAALVGDAMGNDVHQTWVHNNYAMEGIVHERDGEGHVDEWGVHWVKQGPFNQIVRSPLAEASADEVRAYRFPYDRVDALVARMDAVLAAGEDYVIGCDVSPCIFEMYARLRGMETALFDLGAEPALADEMLARCADFAVALAELACRRYPLDWLWTGDDVGGQGGMMMGPEAWRRLGKPHLERVVAVGSAADMPVAYHCCGAIRPIIPDLIDMGIGVLNPVQCNCPGMDPLELKREFGRDLTFMGGVDTQDVLPHGTADDVRRATRRLLDGMTADGGGYILAASHTVPPETPVENIFAMYEEAGLPREAIRDRAAGLRAQASRGDH